MVLAVDPQVICELTDARRQETDLHIRGACVARMQAVLFRYLALLRLSQHISRGQRLCVFPPYIPSPPSIAQAR